MNWMPGARLHRLSLNMASFLGKSLLLFSTRNFRWEFFVLEMSIGGVFLKVIEIFPSLLDFTEYSGTVFFFIYSCFI